MGKNRPGRTNQKGRNKHAPFVMIRRDIYSSASFRDLSNIAVRIFLEIRRRFNGFNNGEISLSCREAATVAHCGKGTAQKALRELMDHGLIKKAHEGQFHYRLATTWTLTSEPLGDAAPTNEWRDWQPEK